MTDIIDKMIALTEEDKSKVSAIAAAIESMELLPTGDRKDCEMDLCAVHAVHGLKLSNMLLCAYSDNPEFVSEVMHDINGIHRYLDRETGELKNCFLPRFSNPEISPE